MAVQPPKIAPPSDDVRWKFVIATMRRYGFAPHALIETLHSIQNVFGYQDEIALRFVSQALNAPLSKVYGVATFYRLFTFKPPGEHTCVVCMGTACYIKGAGQLLAAVQDRWGVAPGETTPDRKLSLVTARCIGSCGLAPAAVLDGEVAAKVTPAGLLEKVEQWWGEPATTAAANGREVTP